MKTLLIVRHAKSSWDSDASTDAERPLNARGKQDAPMMAKRLLEKKITIDRFVSSPAKRAKRTAQYFLEEYEGKDKQLIIYKDLYEASVKDFYKVVSEQKDGDDCIAIFSHNPGITEFANILTEVKIDNMPTCSVFAVTVKIESWKEFETTSKSFLFFDYPKNVQK